MGFHSGGDTWWAVDNVTVLRTVYPIYPFRNWSGGQPDGDALHCGRGGYALCWTWAGAAHLDFTLIHVDLTLAQGADSVVLKGNSASITAGMSQTYFPPNPYPVDLSELRWRWVSDDATSGDSTTCNSTSGLTCTRQFANSGTMYASAYVNGEQQEKSLHVSVKDTCRTGFAEIDNTVMDSAFKSLWHDSNYSPTTPMADRREVGGWIIQNSPGSYSFVRFTGTSLPCGFDPDPLKPAGGVAFVHTHPFNKGEKQTSCDPLTPGSRLFVNYSGESSNDDEDASRTWSLPGYILDADGLIRFTEVHDGGKRHPYCGY